MPKFTGPKDGEILTVVFDGKKNGQVKSRFPSLRDTQDLVLLSISGNELCTGKSLGALVEYAVNTHQKKPDGVTPKGGTTFLIADEIYWHNLKKITTECTNFKEFKQQALLLGEEYYAKKLTKLLRSIEINIENFSDSEIDDNDLRALDARIALNSTIKKEKYKLEALKLGDQFFRENLSCFLTPLGVSITEFHTAKGDLSVDEQIKVINKMAADQGKNFEIMRWHTWVSQDTNKKIEQMVPLYELDEDLKMAITRDAENFVARHKDDVGSPELWRHRSRSYLAEENPAVMWLAALLGYNFIIYPGNILKSFEVTREYFLVKEHQTQIKNGQKIQDVCTHSQLCEHFEDPYYFANWLEPNYRRSYSEQQLSDQATSKAKVDYSFFSTSSDEDNKGNNGVRGKRIGEDRAIVSTNTKASSSSQIDLYSDEPQINQQQMVILASLIEGVRLALKAEFTIDFQKEMESSSYPLVQMFQGITSGILLDSHLSTSEKLDLLKGLTDNYIKVNDSAPIYRTRLYK